MTCTKFTKFFSLHHSEENGTCAYCYQYEYLLPNNSALAKQNRTKTSNSPVRKQQKERFLWSVIGFCNSALTEKKTVFGTLLPSMTAW